MATLNTATVAAEDATARRSQPALFRLRRSSLGARSLLSATTTAIVQWQEGGDAGEDTS